jgi:predicted glycosyltransferase
LTTRQKTVLVCPLDWGLGHASRMIPVISLFLDCGAIVILGGSGRSGALLKITFPHLAFVSIPSPVIRYSKTRFTIPVLLWQLPRMLTAVVKEHRRLTSIIQQHHVDIVISDNRYGLFNRKVYTVFISHQLSPVMPLLLKWAEYPLYRIIKIFIEKYNECWIPDVADANHNLSGKLSHRFRLPSNARFIGILSRFNKGGKGPEDLAAYDTVVVLSGPEPQVSILERLIVARLQQTKAKVLIINGMREISDINSSSPGRITVVDHLHDDQFQEVLNRARTIVCRAGYSAIMDLVALGKTAMLVPTPGQTEQQYLAKHLGRKKLFEWIKQDQVIKGVWPVPGLSTPRIPTEGRLGKADIYRVLQKENGKDRKITHKES